MPFYRTIEKKLRSNRICLQSYRKHTATAIIQGETRKCSYSLKIELIEKVAFLFDVTVVNICLEVLDKCCLKTHRRKTAFSNDPDLQAHELQ